MAKKTSKKYSSSSSRKGKPVKVTRKPQRSSGYKKPAVKRKVSTARPSFRKKTSATADKNATARALLKEFNQLQRQPAPTKKTLKRPVKKATKRVYKDKYQENLANILNKLQKDVSDLKKAKEPQPIQWSGAPPKKEAFPEDEDFIEIPTTQAEALALIAELRREINQRNIMLDEMMNQPGKQYFTD